MIRLTLPYPISANAYWQSFVPPGSKRALVHLSNEAKAYKKAVASMCFAARVTSPIKGRVEIAIQLYPQRPQDWQTRQRKHGAAWDDSVRCIDLDNANKVLLDSIKGVAIEDDKWVRKLAAERMEPDEHGARVVVTITPLQESGPAQAALLPDAESEMEGAF